MFRVYDAYGKDVTDKEEWYIDVSGVLYFMTNDIDSPLQEAADYGYYYKMAKDVVK